MIDVLIDNANSSRVGAVTHNQGAQMSITDPVFNEFEAKEIIADGESVYDFLGGGTSTRFKTAWAKYAPTQGSKFSPKLPVINEHYLDWVAMLETVVKAQDQYRVIELGAGWGTWSSAALMACRQKPNIKQVEAIAVEASSIHHEWMVEHFEANKLTSGGIHLVHGAVGPVAGEVEFPVLEDPAADYGGSLRQSASAKQTETVQQYTLADLLGRLTGPVDFLHIDIQGAEYDIFPEAISLMNDQVKSALIGTHISSERHAGLVKAFENAGWEIRMDYERGQLCRTPYGDIQLGDGVVVVNNPKFA